MATGVSPDGWPALTVVVAMHTPHVIYLPHPHPAVGDAGAAARTLLLPV